MADWQLVLIFCVVQACILIFGAAWGYAFCRWVSDRKFRQWLDQYPRQGLRTTKPPTPIQKAPPQKRAKPATKPAKGQPQGVTIPPKPYDDEDR